jgi:Flp pilus assembly protein TadG
MRELHANRSKGFLLRIARNRQGMAAVEFAMLVPIMFLLFAGTIEFSQALTVDRRVTQIASSTADLIARQKTITSSEVAGVMEIIDHLMRPYDPSLLRVTVLDVMASISDVNKTTVCWSYQHNGGAATYTNGQSYPVPAGIVEAGNSVIVAEVVYDYQPLMFEYFISSTFSLREKFYLKPRLSSYVEYNGTKCI